MKIKSGLFLAFPPFSLAGFSQKKNKNPTYNTKINNAKKVEINGGNTNISKVDSLFIGQVVTNNSTAIRNIGSKG